MIPDPVLSSAIIGTVAVLALLTDSRDHHLHRWYTDGPQDSVYRREIDEHARGNSVNDQRGKITAGPINRDVLLPSVRTTDRLDTGVEFPSSSLVSIVSDAWPAVIAENESLTTLKLENRAHVICDWPGLGGNGGWLDAHTFRSLADFAGTDLSVTNTPPSSFWEDITNTLGGVDRWHS